MAGDTYSADALAMWARRMRGWRAREITVYRYFDDDEQGYPPANALTLARLVAAGSDEGARADAKTTCQRAPA